MSVHAVLGLTFGIGDATVALSYNAPLLIPLPANATDYRVRIAPALTEKGVKQLTKGIKIAGKGSVLLIVEVDNEFGDINVRPLTQHAIIAYTASLRQDEAKVTSALERFESVVAEVDEHSELGKLLLLVTDEKVLKTGGAVVKFILEGLFDLDWQALTKDVQALNQTHTIIAPQELADPLLAE